MRALSEIFLAAVLATSAQAEAPRIEVFTTARHPIVPAHRAGVEVYHLDAPAAIEAELSATLPPDPDGASQFASAWILGAWRELAEALTRAYRGLLKARQYGLARLPAIVFDGRAVVYGITDLDQALGDYRRWRARSP
jgi:integrating conjugative element protein (TIGR03757 family)